jgi:tRNA dimethylallyltransferase
VINADSMQLYRGMDIGTAKLTTAERQGVPHHLLDIWDVTQAANVADYQRLARAEIDRLNAQGRVPVLVGGSGLYVRAAIDPLEFPGTDAAVRARLEAELEEGGPGPLHARLAAVDPEAARLILPSNGRRIVRALEVVEITGRPFTASLPGPESQEPVYDTVQVGVDVPRPVLDERIVRRVDRMWEEGLVAEVRALEGAGLREGRTASRALGYQQVLAAFAGECTEDEARAETARATKRFARRQDSWFRRDGRVHWLTAQGGELADRALTLLQEAVTA